MFVYDSRSFFLIASLTVAARTHAHIREHPRHSQCVRLEGKHARILDRCGAYASRAGTLVLFAHYRRNRCPPCHPPLRLLQTPRKLRAPPTHSIPPRSPPRPPPSRAGEITPRPRARRAATPHVCARAHPPLTFATHMPRVHARPRFHASGAHVSLTARQ